MSVVSRYNKIKGYYYRLDETWYLNYHRKSNWTIEIKLEKLIIIRYWYWYKIGLFLNFFLSFDNFFIDVLMVTMYFDDAVIEFYRGVSDKNMLTKIA